MKLEFCRLPTHTGPVLRLYRALLSHSRQLNFPPFTPKDSEFLRELIRRSFRLTKEYTSFIRVRTILERAYAKERVLRLAAWKRDKDAISRVYSQLRTKRAKIDYNAFLYLHFRRNPRRKHDVDLKYRARQSEEAVVRNLTPAIKMRKPGLDADTVRRLALKMHEKRTEFLRMRKQRYFKVNPPVPSIVLALGVFNVPFIRHAWGQERKYGKRVYAARALFQKLIDKRHIAVETEFYARAEDKWERDVEGRMEDETYLETARGTTGRIDSFIDKRVQYYRRQQSVVMRTREFEGLEVKRRANKFPSRFTLTPDERDQLELDLLN